jgi:hypothetical protein
VGVAFPFERNKDEFETSLGKRTKLPPDAYALHALNNPDKHRPSLVPVNMQTLTNMTGIMVFCGIILTVGPRAVRRFALDIDSNFSQSDHSKGQELGWRRFPNDHGKK